jgi:hypothetical protein
MRRKARGVAPRDLWIVVRRIALVLIGLEIAYVAAANALLSSGLIKAAVNANGDFELSYASASSFVPGRVNVRDFRLRMQDYNVEFALVIGNGTIDIDLLELARRKFHATRVGAERTRFFMRHKVLVIGDDGARIAAFPKIRGLPDPPFYSGVRSPPTPDRDYDLWRVRVDNVYAEVDELWIMEYRLLGRALAKGSFVVEPQRRVSVEPASLEIESGALLVGEQVVARRASGRIDFSMPHLDVKKVEGLAVVDQMSARLRLALDDGELGFLDYYLARHGSARFSGRAAYRIDAGVERGVVAPRTRLTLTADPLRLTRPHAGAAGAITLELRGDPQRPDALLLSAVAPRIQGERAGVDPQAAPRLEQVTASLEVLGARLSSEKKLGKARLEVQRALAPTLSWFAWAKNAPSLLGSAIGRLRIQRESSGALRSEAALDVDAARLTKGSVGIEGDLRGTLKLMREAAPEAPFELEHLRLAFEQVKLRSGSKNSQTFNAVIDASGLELTPGPQPGAEGIVALRASSAEALVPLAADGVVRDVSTTALSLDDPLRARAAVSLQEDWWQVRLLDAASGNLRVRGHVSKRSGPPRGAFLFSAGPINVGVVMQDGSTDVVPFVADDWLNGAPRSPARQPQKS